jgi:hypothetical protein
MDRDVGPATAAVSTHEVPRDRPGLPRARVPATVIAAFATRHLSDATGPRRGVPGVSVVRVAVGPALRAKDVARLSPRS